MFAAISLVGVLLASAFAIDLAQLYLAKRELQNLANLTALDTARAAGGCLAPDIDRQSTSNNVALASLQRNGGQSSWLVSNQVVLGRAAIDADTLRQFTPVDPENANQALAFEVRLQRPFPRLVLPLPGFDTAANPLNARAVSAMAPVASFQVGSFLGELNLSDGEFLNDLLSNALGTPVGISLVSYQALADAPIELGSVAAELGDVTVQELLSDPISLRGFLNAIVNALFDSGEDAAAVAVAAVAASAPDDMVILDDTIGTPQDVVNGVGEVGISALELVRAAALQAGEPVLALTPDLTIPGVGNVVGTVTLGQAASLGVGPALQDASAQLLTTARNTQAQVGITAALLPVLGNPVNVNLRLDLIDATAELREIRCADRDNPQHEIDLDVRTGLARLVVDNPPSNPLVDLGITRICWVGSVDLSAEDATTLTFPGPFSPDDPELLERNTQTVGSAPGASLGGALSDLATESPPYICGPGGILIDPIVQPVLAALSGTLNPVLQQLVDPLLLPLLRGLGANIAGADVTVLDVRMPPPALIEAN